MYVCVCVCVDDDQRLVFTHPSTNHPPTTIGSPTGPDRTWTSHTLTVTHTIINIIIYPQRNNNNNNKNSDCDGVRPRQLPTKHDDNALFCFLWILFAWLFVFVFGCIIYHHITTTTTIIIIRQQQEEKTNSSCDFGDDEWRWWQQRRRLVRRSLLLWSVPSRQRRA